MLRQFHYSAAALLRVLGACAIIGTAACADALVIPEHSAGTASPTKRMERGHGGGTVEAVCRTSLATPSGPHTYEYGTLKVKLSASARSTDGSTREYRYRGYANGAELIAVANCVIPNSTKAIEEMHRFFRVPKEKQQPVHDGGAQLMSMGDEPVTLEPINVVACPYGDPLGYPNCSPREPMELAIETPTCNWWVGCGDGGSYSGGSYSSGGGGSSPEPNNPTPCNTSDPVIDSPAVQDGFKQVWNNAMATNRETGAWIVRNSDGTYTAVPLTIASATACTINFANNPPPGTVAWVHAHPFSPGDTMGACGNPQFEYPGAASDEDQQVTDALGGMRGFALDAEQIIEFRGSAYQMQRTYNRCGY